MDLAQLTKEFGGGPLALVAAGLLLTVGPLFYLLIASKNRQIARGETRVDVLEKKVEELNAKADAEQVRHEAALAALHRENRQEVVALSMATNLLLTWLDKRGKRKEKEAHVSSEQK